MEIKHFTNKSDLKQSISLRKYVFHSAYTEQKAKDYGCLLDMADKIGEFKDNKLLGQVLNLPIKINIYNNEIPAVGINHVGVYPENRSLGIASDLMVESLKSAQNHGQIVAILEPFAPSFYRKFGYDLFTERISYRVPLKNYPKFKKDKSFRVVRKPRCELDDIEIENIWKCYQIVASQTHGMQLRDKTWWQRHNYQYPNLNYGFVYDGKRITGYVSYRLNGTTMEIIDFIYLSNDIRQQLWSFLTAHGSNVFEIIGVSTSNHNLSYDFNDPRIEQQLWLNTMIRIVDLKEFLKLWIQSFSLKSEITFSVEDKFAPWNNGTYKLEGTLVKCDEMEDGFEKITMQQLAAIFLGPLSQEQLVQFMKPDKDSSLLKLINLSRGKKTAHFLGEF
ncbi:GNAT family N-acetyltransferase [Companilactobacillus kimchii]|uniref:N-acetyltransferase domain-containing protein n=2 Tax=Companilactobacillus kimchii TaxID=2801452 RepID=A0A210PA78_9LACO|nr:GNAT family N-acetyltransferase [Companilactobacillus kimchii]KAE9559863.1 hypothetical protein ATN91_10215 [Companilactobacillus kimchii]OWF33399.1 hypothetical protein LKACC12383_01005 [Companilactobacillus kimchii]GEO46479.1 GNAT family acetyltransferase [Companilactobacillus paralimentarius]